MSLARTVSKAVFAAADTFLQAPSGPRILIYHAVGLETGRQLEVTESNFMAQMDYLARTREVVSLDSALARWDEPGAERLVVLTFDDGYRSVFANAFPALAERRFPFTVYLATEMLERGHDDLGVPALTWDEIRRMNESGLATIGSHTHTHRDLRHASDETILHELNESDGLIEDRLGVRPDHFAYPWGYWSESADPIVRERYSSAALGAKSPRSSSESDPWKLFRSPIQLSDGQVWFHSRLKGGLATEELLRRRLRNYEGP